MRQRLPKQRFRWLMGCFQRNVRNAAGPILVAITAFVLIVPAAQAAGNQLYRFRNLEGQIEISNSIPTDRVARGYEVLDARSGRVVAVIEPQKSQAEVDRIKREELARNACRTALERVISLYQNDQDIKDAKKQAIAALEERIENANANLGQAVDQRLNLEATAAHEERSGKALDAGLVRNLRQTNLQIVNLENEIEHRHLEQVQARDRFARDLALFQQASCDNEAEFGFPQADVAKIDGGKIDGGDQ
jgi:antitoxin (DNA-binding transcriptional repressor) of toxin-antitoxin stability system